jgi:RimJ/RimL family protein N-acetyltransferase
MNVILRPWTPEDLDSLVIHANNFNVSRFMTDGFPYPYTAEDGISFIAFANEDNPVHIFAIVVNGKAVGGIGIHPQTGIMRNNAELGYWLGEPYWRKGIMTSAIGEMIPFAFQTYDINRIFARPFGNNTASQKLLEKSGFTLEARLEKVILKNGEVLDELIYAKRR